jgi:glycerophosphoryl diester phosphodiesterase
MPPPRPHWPYPHVIAHRGGGALAPENTLAALRYARNLGFRGVELDVQLSADGVPVLIHDETLERTTNGTGRVSEQPFEVLGRLDAGGWFGNEYLGEPLPALAAAGALCREAGLWVNIEIKASPGREAETGAAVAKMAKLLWAGAPLPPLLSSFSGETLRAAQRTAPELPRGYLCTAIPDEWQSLLQALGCVSLHAAWDRLDRAGVEAVHAVGFGVLAYTVNDSETALDLLEMGVDALVTDQLEQIGPAFA